MNERTVNLLGAVAQLVSDRQLAAIERASDLSATSAAALVTISQAPEQSIDTLHKTLGRSQPATTRLVAKLESAGLLRRGLAEDSRAVALSPTVKGQRMVARILSARRHALRECLGYLTNSEQEELDGLLAKTLATAVVDEQHAYQICRLCDGDECDVCPVEDALEEA